MKVTSLPGPEAMTAPPPPPPPALRWAVLGCANIAKKNVRAMFLSPSAKLTAVASRDAARCRAWVDEHVMPPDRAAVHCFGSYEALLAAPAVFDAVYVPLPTALHVQWVPRFAAAGKHVLCEKPVGVTLEEVGGRPVFGAPTLRMMGLFLRKPSLLVGKRL